MLEITEYARRFDTLHWRSSNTLVYTILSDLPFCIVTSVVFEFSRSIWKLSVTLQWRYTNHSDAKSAKYKIQSLVTGIPFQGFRPNPEILTWDGNNFFWQKPGYFNRGRNNFLGQILLTKLINFNFCFANGWNITFWSILILLALKFLKIRKGLNFYNNILIHYGSLHIGGGKYFPNWLGGRYCEHSSTLFLHYIEGLLTFASIIIVYVWYTTVLLGESWLTYLQMVWTIQYIIHLRIVRNIDYTK